MQYSERNYDQLPERALKNPFVAEHMHFYSTTHHGTKGAHEGQQGSDSLTVLIFWQ